MCFIILPPIINSPIKDNPPSRILSHVEIEAGDTLKFFKYIPEASISDTQKKISKMSPELLLLGYRLNEKPVEDNKIAEYKAGPVAQQFRDLAIDNYKNDLPFLPYLSKRILEIYMSQIKQPMIYSIKFFLKPFLLTIQKKQPGK